MKTKFFFLASSALIGAGVVCVAPDAMDRKITPQSPASIKSSRQKFTLSQTVTFNAQQWRAAKPTSQGYFTYFRKGETDIKQADHITVDGWSEREQAFVFHVTIMEKATAGQKGRYGTLRLGEKLSHADTISYIYKQGDDFITNKITGKNISVEFKSSMPDQESDIWAQGFVKAMKRELDNLKEHIHNLQTCDYLARDNQKYKEELERKKRDTDKSSNRESYKPGSRNDDRRDLKTTDRKNSYEHERGYDRRYEDRRDDRSTDRRERNPKQETEGNSVRDREREKLKDQRSSPKEMKYISEPQDEKRKRDVKSEERESSDSKRDLKRPKIAEDQLSDKSKGKKEVSTRHKEKAEVPMAIETQTRPKLQPQQQAQQKSLKGGLIPYNPQPKTSEQQLAKHKEPSIIISEEDIREARKKKWDLIRANSKITDSTTPQTTQTTSDDKSGESTD